MVLTEAPDMRAFHHDSVEPGSGVIPNQETATLMSDDQTQPGGLIQLDMNSRFAHLILTMKAENILVLLRALVVDMIV